MAWVRVDDQFTEHPKLVEAGPLGVAMQMAALCYANRNLTDGELPAKVVARFMPTVAFDPESGERITWKDVADRLVALGIWEEIEGGYLIHDYLDYQPSKANVEAERAAARERMARRRMKREEVNNGQSSDEVRANFGRSSASPIPNPLKDDDDDARAGASETANSQPDTPASTESSDNDEWRRLTLLVFGAAFDRYTADMLEHDCADMGVEVVMEAMRRTVERATENRSAYYRSIVKGWRGKVRSLDDVRLLDEATRTPTREPPRRLSALELAAQSRLRKGGARE